MPTSKKPTHLLSNKSRGILEFCAKMEMKRLESLHWTILPYLKNPKTKKEGKDQMKVLAAIASDNREVEAAIKELNHTYEMQFPAGRRSYLKTQKILARQKTRK